MKLINTEEIPWQTTETIGDNPVEVKLVLKQSIDTMSTIEIVCCKECKHRPGYESKGCFDTVCPFADGRFRRVPDDDFFCKAGERKCVD